MSFKNRRRKQEFQVSRRPVHARGAVGKFMFSCLHKVTFVFTGKKSTAWKLVILYCENSTFDNRLIGILRIFKIHKNYLISTCFKNNFETFVKNCDFPFCSVLNVTWVSLLHSFIKNHANCFCIVDVGTKHVKLLLLLILHRKQSQTSRL